MQADDKLGLVTRQAVPRGHSGLPPADHCEQSRIDRVVKFVSECGPAGWWPRGSVRTGSRELTIDRLGNDDLANHPRMRRTGVDKGAGAVERDRSRLT